MKKSNLLLSIVALSLLLTTTVFASDFRNIGFSMMNGSTYSAGMMQQNYYSDDNYNASINYSNNGYRRSCH